MKKSINKALFYILLLCMYGAFFSVESFYNFEGQSNAREFLRYLAGRQVAQSRPAVKGDPIRTIPHGIRLNKRYHQEDIPPCPIYVPAAPERNVTPLRLGARVRAGLPSVALVHYSLRGPPAGCQV